MNPCFTTLCLALDSNFHTFHPHQPQKPLIFLHYSVVDQPYEKEVYFYSFVTKSNQPSTKYSSDVFSSFYRTVTHRESNRIFTSPPLNSVSPCFTRTSSFCYLPIFSLQPSKPSLNDKQDFSRS